MTGTVYLSFNAGVSQKTAQTLLAVMFQQIAEGFDHIYIMFSTSGGTVSDGITLYNSIRSMPAKVTMHNVGNVDSIGNAIFLGAKERFACQHSTFMFHGVGRDLSGWYDERPLREYLEGTLADQRRIGAIIAENTSLKFEQINNFFSTAQTKDADFAVEHGIAHEIRDVVIPTGAPVIPLVFD